MKFGETLVLLGIFVVLPTIIVWLVSRYKKHETDKRAEIALAAIEKDSDLDLEEFFKKMNPPRRSIKERLLDKLNELAADALGDLIGDAEGVLEEYRDAVSAYLTKRQDGANGE